MKRLFLALLLCCSWPVLASDPPAKELFAAKTLPSNGQARVIGSYARGCLAGAVSLPADGNDFQTMRPSHHRNWGDPALITLIERLASDAKAAGWPGLLVGDMTQPRGGPLNGGHASHQIGLDVDIWLTPMPSRRLSSAERDNFSAVSMLKSGTRTLDQAVFGNQQVALIRTAAEETEVERIFVHPAIKQALCQAAGPDRAWLRKVRPWWGHDDHIHVRLRCPQDQTDCQSQEPPPAGDGCGSELAWWLSDKPWKKPAVPAPPPKPLMLADLPPQCREVLQAP